MGKNIIPKSFSLGGIDWKVVITDEEDKNGCFGSTSYSRATVQITPTRGGKKINKDVQEQTFAHELVHAILMCMNREDLNKDELFVDNFGTMLHQYLKTKK